MCLPKIALASFLIIPMLSFSEKQCENLEFSPDRLEPSEQRTVICPKRDVKPLPKRPVKSLNPLPVGAFVHEPGIQTWGRSNQVKEGGKMSRYDLKTHSAKNRALSLSLVARPDVAEHVCFWLQDPS